MDIKVSLVLTDRGRKHTSLGFERIDILDFGYAKDGTLETVLCVGEYSEGHVPTSTFGIFPIVGADIFDDLFMHYNVEKEANGHLLCAICGR